VYNSTQNLAQNKTLRPRSARRVWKNNPIRSGCQVNQTGEEQMNIKAYFEQDNTPDEHSPVGMLMVRVLAKNEGMTFEQARGEANRLLDRAAGRERYSIPRVLSVAEQASLTEKTRAYFSKSRTVNRASQNAHQNDLQPNW
jgi:hypothetical protein